ncbi:MAG: thiamine pyrophosphate-binding protein [Asticcacaulis sp.]
MPIYDALAGSGLKHILVRHEQGAAFAADAYARASGKVGVCMATSGPGATNLITGIANAYMDSVPLVCITGQVATHLLGTDGFQEVDILGLTLPIVKHSWLVRDPADIPAILAEAFAIASEGRPGRFWSISQGHSRRPHQPFARRRLPPPGRRPSPIRPPSAPPKS